MTKSQIPGIIASATALAPITAHRFVSCGVGGVVTATAGASVYGVANHDAGTGEQLAIVVTGLPMVECGAAIPAGTVHIDCDAQGRAIVGAGAGIAKLCPGQEGAAAGDFVMVKLAN